MQVGEMDFETESGTLYGPKGKAQLTPREADLLNCLASQADTTLTRQELLEKAWGWQNAQDLKTKTVDVHVQRLRAKLEKTGLSSGLITTVRGTGYRFTQE